MKTPDFPGFSHPLRMLVNLQWIPAFAGMTAFLHHCFFEPQKPVCRANARLKGFSKVLLEFPRTAVRLRGNDEFIYQPKNLLTR